MNRSFQGYPAIFGCMCLHSASLRWQVVINSILHPVPDRKVTGILRLSHVGWYVAIKGGSTTEGDIKDEILNTPRPSSPKSRNWLLDQWFASLILFNNR